MRRALGRWWEDRNSRRRVARDELEADRRVARVLHEEFAAHKTDQLWFGVKALPGRRLELTVWPEGGVDTFEAAVGSPEAVELTFEEFRGIVKLYEDGERPPFPGDIDRDWA